jgi:trans-aconitate methyltransferase
LTRTSRAISGWTASDWDNYWIGTQLSQKIVLAQKRWVKRVTRFCRTKSLRLDSAADFGCGPAIALFELARRLPRVQFYGFDASLAIVKKNGERARELAIRNISFNRIQLPLVPRGMAFDLVLCIATLHYLKDNLLAIENLFTTLEPGGFLIFNYPNAYSRQWYQKNATGDTRRRFAVLLAGENILSKRIIEDAIRRPCHNFWREMGESAPRGNPCVYVRKPERTV